ncbi:hypothetical protein [Burkholderia cenocepacia]|uniref:hypothetical protein n=1 Tax=Burkholderia cenocepacia TaxID=95486 RepID=UPI000760CAAA|nr:hypothetical protein [Burkholderia cenocepacia]KWU26317.1 hypothetical protein AS149_25335 [Burkholderia cenocepacia]
MKDPYSKLKPGWRIESESPLTLRHQDGSLATGEAAQMLLPLIMGALTEDVPTVQNYAIWHKGDEARHSAPGWMSSQGHVALYSKDKAELFSKGLGDRFIVRPVFLKTVPLE